VTVPDTTWFVTKFVIATDPGRAYGAASGSPANRPWYGFATDIA